jgi:predicted component of type VI protein secretion system
LTVATLTGKTVEISIPPCGTCLDIKRQLEDLEGWRIEDQSLRTVKNQVLEDSDKLESVGITPEAKSR